MKNDTPDKATFLKSKEKAGHSFSRQHILRTDRATGLVRPWFAKC